MAAIIKPITVFANRYPWVGSMLWITTVQYYLIQLIVALDWPTPYSLIHNTISDLGNTACGIYMGEVVCSPLHNLMNGSFVLVGLTMGLGSLFIYCQYRRSLGTIVGFSMMGIAGLGLVIVGLVPENVFMSLHDIGSGLALIVGSVGLMVLGLVLPIQRLLRAYTLLSGLVSLVAIQFFLVHIGFGLDRGGVERLIAYPENLWLIVFGVYLSMQNLSKRLEAGSGTID